MNTSGRRRAYVPVVGPRLRRLLLAVFALFALLAINSVYLAGITWLEFRSGETYQDYFYQYMFLAHLVLGLALIGPVIVYGILHIRNAYNRPNRRAVKAGYALFVTALGLLGSGLVLTRGIPFLEIQQPSAREIAYWAHVATPLIVAWLFILHRLAGKRINWRAGAAVAGFAAVLVVVAAVLQTQDPRRWNQTGPASGERYFFPSLARTSSGGFIPPGALMMDAYCADCHADVHESWSVSAHRFASFNNPAYLFSVRETRADLFARDGDVQGARFCAGCHDLVPFFSGAFDDPDFDDTGDPTAQAGITCTGCHAITHVNSPRGNADYTIEEPQHYPFAFSDAPFLQWLNRTLVKAKPAFHRKTFLKPLHRSPEFCGACHKVHLPVEVNGYKWLRGQNHYDSFLLSGVSGHGVASFYYPEKAEKNCNGCHMKPEASGDFGARGISAPGLLEVHDHQFPSANTALQAMLGLPESVNDAHRSMLEGALRVDLFGLREGGSIAGALSAPMRPGVAKLEPGGEYLLEVVLRTLTLGHAFTQGTADSNQVWLEIRLRDGERLIGVSGQRDARERVDPWAHFVNAYVLDAQGRRIDRRNAHDIFTTLYNNQIPPGAADVVHYRFRVPENATGPLSIDASLHYRKFDTTYLELFSGDTSVVNRLPVTTIASDRIELPLASSPAPATAPAPALAPEWQRWNDFGIGLLRRPGTGELRQAEQAFRQVEALGHADGPLNLARVFLREGRLDEAVAALQRAAAFDPPALPWTVAWLTGLVNRQNGYLDEALHSLRQLAETQFPQARARGFDFSRDYRLLNMLALTLFERAKLERGDARRPVRDEYLNEATDWYRRALALDPENVSAHYGLSQVYAWLGDEEAAQRHRALHARYKPDDNAADRAIAIARSNDPAADRAAEAITVYDLQRAMIDDPREQGAR